jgi:hypothetical protein
MANNIFMYHMTGAFLEKKKYLEGLGYRFGRLTYVPTTFHPVWRSIVDPSGQEAKGLFGESDIVELFRANMRQVRIRRILG